MRLLLPIAGAVLLVSAATIALRYRGQFAGDFSLGFATSTISAFVLASFGIMRSWQRDANYAKVGVLSYIHPRRMFRLSAAYLYRFEVENDFLLIRNLAHGSVAPVGGVYKYYDAARSLLNDFHFVQALGTTLTLPEKFDHDLRIAVELRYAQRLLTWLRSGTGREYCPDREFREELIDTGLLTSPFPFTQVECSKFCTETRLSSYDEGTGWYNFHYFDVFCLRLNQTQVQTIRAAVALDETQSGQDPSRQRLFLASAAEVRRGRLNNGQQLGEHTRYIL